MNIAYLHTMRTMSLGTRRMFRADFAECADFVDVTESGRFAHIVDAKPMKAQLWLGYPHEGSEEGWVYVRMPTQQSPDLDILEDLAAQGLVAAIGAYSAFRCLTPAGDACLRALEYARAPANDRLPVLFQTPPAMLWDDERLPSPPAWWTVPRKRGLLAEVNYTAELRKYEATHRAIRRASKVSG